MQSKYQNAKFQKNLVFVKQMLPPKKTDSGIIHSASETELLSREQFFKGEVISIGSEVTFCKVGDTILIPGGFGNPWFEKNTDSSVDTDGWEGGFFAYFRENDIVAVL